jgi:hypothetical protein
MIVLSILISRRVVMALTSPVPWIMSAGSFGEGIEHVAEDRTDILKFRTTFERIPHFQVYLAGKRDGIMLHIPLPPS